MTTCCTTCATDLVLDDGRCLRCGQPATGTVDDLRVHHLPGGQVSTGTVDGRPVLLVATRFGRHVLRGTDALAVADLLAELEPATRHAGLLAVERFADGTTIIGDGTGAVVVDDTTTAAVVAWATAAAQAM